MTAMIAFAVSGLVAFLNIGLRTNYLSLWLKAIVTAWPIAAIGCLFSPFHSPADDTEAGGSARRQILTAWKRRTAQAAAGAALLFLLRVF
jgi:hypothetical protein